MTPTQPTPEEQVEAHPTPEQVAEWALKRAKMLSKGEPVEVGGPFGDQDWVRAAVLAAALLTQQSQEPQNAQEWAAEAGQLHDKVVRLQAELDRAVGRIESADAFLADPAGNPIDAINLARKALAASPGKGAEGEAGNG